MSYILSLSRFVCSGLHVSQEGKDSLAIIPHGDGEFSVRREKLVSPQAAAIQLSSQVMASQSKAVFNRRKKRS